MIKNIKIEIFIIGILLINILFSYVVDIEFNNFFGNFNKPIWQGALKSFFINITSVGNSLWYFIFSLSFVVFFLFLKKIDRATYILQSYKVFFQTNCLLFLSVLVAGTLSQILKHIVGRPRPNMLLLENNIGFNFFTFDSNFHSFPSGHTSTIFAVALVCAIAAPKIKYFFYFFALIVSFSRVVVGAHFITDVIGGIAVAFIGYKISKLILCSFFSFPQNSKECIIVDNKFNLSLLVGILLVAFMSVGPTFDIFFSGLFYHEDNKFVLQSFYKISLFFRKIILPLILVYILILPIFSLFIPTTRIYFGYTFKLKDILFLWITSMLNLVVIINLILKNLWGRARPNDILELGGKDFFTPWYKITNQCSVNCSFVSGDAAVGFSLIVFFFLTKKEIYFWLSLFFGLSIGFIRILEGGHFLSDITFSYLVVFTFYFITDFIYSKKSYG